MQLDWNLAVNTARRLQGDLPSASRPEALQTVAQLRVVAEQAGRWAQQFSRLPGAPAPEVEVVDRATWAERAASMVESVLAELDMTEPSPRVLRGGYGLAAGGLLGLLSRALLGQFDAFSAQPRLYLLAPNLVRLARKLPGEDRHFYMWVSVHEQTHAVQFSSHPWLRDFTVNAIKTTAHEDSMLLRAARELLRPGQHPSTTADLMAVMTLLEGHADFIADRVGRRHIPKSREFRRFFAARQQRTRGFSRWLGAADKNRQYRLGLEFCTQVSRRVSVRGLNRVFEGPETLPTMAELAQPQDWLRRVHGKT